jgi:hypothetical protein
MIWQQSLFPSSAVAVQMKETKMDWPTTRKFSFKKGRLLTSSGD